MIAGANAYDGNYLIPLLEKIRSLSFDFQEVYGDNHYGTFENWAKVPILFNARCFFALAEDAVFREDGTTEIICKYFILKYVF